MTAAPDKTHTMTDALKRCADAVETFMAGEACKDQPPDEKRLLDERRRAIAPSESGRFTGLALSGGGIRSATFALGVLQALAGRRRDPAQPGKPAGFRDSLLSRFDYLSTVSGGGFIGAFLVGLFVPGRLRESPAPAPGATPEQQEQAAVSRAADDAQAVLDGGPPGRIRADACKTDEFRLRAPLAWLRENGRYLTPTGTGDLVYAAALGLRNWISLHVVIGVALLAAMTLLAAVRSWLLHQAWAEPLYLLEGAWLNNALAGIDQPSDSVWWSTLFLVALAPLALWVLPTGIAYWTTSRRPDGLSLPVNRSMVGMTGAVLVFAMLAWHGTGDAPALRAVWGALAGVTLLGVLVHVVLAIFQPTARMQAVQLTRWLASGLIAAGVVALLAVIETLGHTLYLLTITGPAWLPSLPAALGAALAWLGKKIGASGSASALPGWMQKMPLTTLGGIAGLAALLLIATLWAWVVQWLAWQGGPPSVAGMASAEHLWLLLTHAGAWCLLAAGVGQFPAFINLSSLQSFYAARLIRTYLGASNRERFDGDARHLSAAEPLPGDNLSFDALYDKKIGQERLKTWAPLHLVNVTVNKTIDPAEQLVQRDRKGQPMAVMPYGFAIDGWRNLFKPDGGKFPLNPTMHLGDWVGTSGAAFSTGIGRETTLGMSLLMGAANVRLGVWWASGLHRKDLPAWWRVLTWAGRGLGTVFRTQTYLSYEFSARFYGLRRRWQYLSDGGHFENTALYELLRPERDLGLIVASDNGADPAYRFDDLANLMRLARIDLRVDVSVVSDFGEHALLKTVFGTTADFSADGGKTNPAALLLKAVPVDDDQAAPCWIVLLKPSPQAGAPADVLQYAKTHPDFPQEPTSDQFFDEAQWESYRSLGQYIAGRVLEAKVWAELEKFMRGPVT
ncbi:MAG TPA: patatin-like phospholipase family protein [Roseateles sp.]